MSQSCRDTPADINTDRQVNGTKIIKNESVSALLVVDILTNTHCYALAGAAAITGHYRQCLPLTHIGSRRGPYPGLVLRHNRAFLRCGLTQPRLPALRFGTHAGLRPMEVQPSDHVPRITLASKVPWFQWNAGPHKGKKRWSYYDEPQQTMIRCAFQRGDAGVDFKIWDAWYTVHLAEDAMKQVKHDTAYERQVRTTWEDPEVVESSAWKTWAVADDPVAKSNATPGRWVWQPEASTTIPVVTQAALNLASQAHRLCREADAEEHSDASRDSDNSSEWSEWQPTWQYHSGRIHQHSGPIWKDFDHSIQEKFRQAYSAGERWVRFEFWHRQVIADLRTFWARDIHSLRTFSFQFY